MAHERRQRAPPSPSGRRGARDAGGQYDAPAPPRKIVAHQVAREAAYSRPRPLRHGVRETSDGRRAQSIERGTADDRIDAEEGEHLDQLDAVQPEGREKEARRIQVLHGPVTSK